MKVAIVMGSTSDMPVMQDAIDILKGFDIEIEVDIVSAHRTPEKLFDFSKNAHTRGIKVIIAGAGGAAHLPGMMASKTRIPVIGVPINTKSLSGLDSLYSIVQMPKGFPVATMAIGEPGAFNAGLMAISILAVNDSNLATKLEQWRQSLSESINEEPNNDR